MEGNYFSPVYLKEIRMKTVPCSISTNSQIECVRAIKSQIPFDYVPPPENIELNVIPYKWPSEDDWSPIETWNYK